MCWRRLCSPFNFLALSGVCLCYHHHTVSSVYMNIETVYQTQLLDVEMKCCMKMLLRYCIAVGLHYCMLFEIGDAIDGRAKSIAANDAVHG
jgi:predicted metal-dependent TIM-barrel fold hydrolase